ncbi:MAG TPA: nucleotidyltransferase domain-containing protein [Elusimicrobiales bacterium]|nr:nucleotidyltransferase domain-containing protein [Elusimicrobiales bacterium]
MITLKADQLKKVKGILAGLVPEYDVLVYGSRADGSAKAHSYLDLAVMADKPLVAPRLENLGAAFSKAGFPFRVETIDWAATGKDYRREIKKTGVLIQNSRKK